nr:Tn3 family transposase [Klebsiella pneumoniae]
GHYWFREPSLRRRVQAGLNKGEARNALARAVFIRRLGEIRERGQVNGDLQIQRLSYMALLTSPTEFSLNLRCVGCVNGMYGKLFRGKSARKG